MDGRGWGVHIYYTYTHSHIHSKTHVMHTSDAPKACVAAVAAGSAGGNTLKPKLPNPEPQTPKPCKPTNQTQPLINQTPNPYT